MTTKFYYKVEFVRSSGVSEEVKERVQESLSRSLVGAWIEGNKTNPWHDGDLGMLVEKQFDKKWSSPRFNSREMAKSCCLAHVQDGGYLTGTFYAYQIIVADVADAVSVNFSGRCKFLQI